MKFIKTNTNNDGFTIVELMMALVVLSTLLLLSTLVMTQIGRLYSKGVNGANLQNAARTINADITSAVQFSGGGTPLPGTDGGNDYRIVGAAPNDVKMQSVCIGAIRYTYVLNKELGEDIATGKTTKHVLWRDTVISGTCGIPDMTLTKPTANGYEMTGEHMRVTNFDIKQISGITNVSIAAWFAYGDSDLLQSLAGNRTACKGGVGSQYCAVSELTTNAVPRTQ